MKPLLLAIGLVVVVGCGGRGDRSGAESETTAVLGRTDSAVTTHNASPVERDARDRGRIAFSDDVEDVYVMNADGSDLTKLTSDPANDFDPAWSPDNKLIAFRSERDGNNEIYVMSAAGRRQRNVSNFPGDDWGPTWSPDGRIAFNSNRGGPDLRLYVAGPDGSRVDRIGGDVWVEYPAWSPDGSRVAFMAQTWEDGDNYEIYVMNADGAAVKRLTNASGSDRHPAWSPDGKKIAFNSERADAARNGLGHRIYVMNADGSRQRQLTEIYGKYPDWSPDGRKLVFAGDRLYVVDADGSGLTPLPTGGVGSPVFPDWTR